MRISELEDILLFVLSLFLIKRIRWGVGVNPQTIWCPVSLKLYPNEQLTVWVDSLGRAPAKRAGWSVRRPPKR